MPAVNDQVYNAAVHFIGERNAYDRLFAQYGKDDPQAVAALMRLQAAVNSVAAGGGRDWVRQGNERMSRCRTP